VDVDQQVQSCGEEDAQMTHRLRMPSFAGTALILIAAAGVDAAPDAKAEPQRFPTLPGHVRITPTPAGGQSNIDKMAALRLRLHEEYRYVQQGNWDIMWDFYTRRCQERRTRADIAESYRIKYGPKSGRDFSGPERYRITIENDTTATVLNIAYDGTPTTPNTWLYEDWQWRADRC
jgi:hypothetical protein